MFENLRGFVPPPRPAEIDLFLDSNEGPLCPRDLIAELGHLSPDLLRRYPSGASVQQLWAKQLGIEPERLLLTAGGDEATDRICRTFLGPGRELILPVPTFEMLGHYSQLAGAKTLEIAWPPGEAYPIDAVLAAVRDRTAVIAMVSPNNPTGALATVEHLQRLSHAAPHALLLVDQAYAEFEHPASDLTQAALKLPNAVVIRTVSKAQGLAGLRIGCVAGPAWIIDTLRAAGGVFPVGTPSLLLTAAALQRPRMSARYVERVRRERDLLVSLIRERGAEAWPSQGNFILARFADPDLVRRSLASEGIAVRPLARRWRAWDLAGCIRITCPGDMLSFERLAAALLRVLSAPVRPARGA